MSINSQQYAQNEAWILFQLGDATVQTKMDGNFHVLALLDVASGLIHGMEFVSSSAEELSEFEAKKLLNSAEAKAGTKPKYLFVDAAQEHVRLKRAATALGIKTIPEAGRSFEHLTEEARMGFAAHVNMGSE